MVVLGDAQLLRRELHLLPHQERSLKVDNFGNLAGAEDELLALLILLVFRVALLHYEHDVVFAELLFMVQKLHHQVAVGDVVRLQRFIVLSQYSPEHIVALEFAYS